MIAQVAAVEILTCCCGRRWRVCPHCHHRTPVGAAHEAPQHPSHQTRIDCNCCGCPTFPEHETR